MYKTEMINLALYQFADDLEFFTASFASWRYNTVCDVFTALLRRRTFCEELFDKSVMGDVQERSLLSQVADACKDAALWRFPATLGVE